MLFSHPAMLWGLLAILVPVAIHLFNFRRYRKVYFSNVDELADLLTESRSRSNVRRWLVLACRVLAVAMLALAFAGPVIPSRGSAVRSGSPVVSIYIDNSFSREAASRDGSQLAAACDKARQIAAAYGAGGRYQLITSDMKGSEMRWLSRDELLSALDEVEPSPAVRQLAEVAERQSAFMAQSGAANRHAFLISDFQRSTSDLTQLPSDSIANFTLVPLDGAAGDNIFIDTLRLDAPAYFVGGSVVVEATVANCGSHDAEKVPVRLYVDGRERAIATVDIPAGSTAKATLPFKIEQEGWHEGMVQTEDYPVTYDDNYYFALNTGGRIGVLEVDGREVSAPLQRLFASDSAIDYRHASQLSQQQAMEASLVILNGLRQLPSGDAAWLAEWVEGGGSLLVIPSAEGVPAELNNLLQRLTAPTVGRWVARQSTASTIDYASSLYSGVFGGRSDDMEMPTVRGHYLTTGQAVRQSVITLADGSDLLSITPAGEGKVYLFTTLPELTDFPSQALFVPTFYNMALYSRPLPAPCHTLGDPSPIVLQTRHDDGGRPPEITDGADLHLIPDLRSAGGRQLMVLHGELTKAGIYTIGQERLAFNYGRRESRLEFLSQSEIAEAVGGRKEYSLLQPGERPLDQVLRERDGGHRLWRLCLLLALLALAAETVALKLDKTK